ncbi:unnamed protein product [Calypogeia fissa]
MAELLRGRGASFWDLGATGRAAALQPKKKLGGSRWRVVASPRAASRGPGDDNQTKQKLRKLPERVCAAAGLAALLLASPQQNLSFLPFVGHLAVESSSAKAAGLLSMPPQTLNNRYFLVRAGYSFFESKGVIHTNPVSKTSVDSGLSDEGIRQATKAALELKDLGACEGSCWIWPSITQRAYQAAEVIAYVNKVNYSRIVPEYSFLDARGFGAYENRELSAITEVYASDLESSTLRPPKFSDGTPNESVSDVLVRVTQLMSILETQYFGDTVIIVSPDSDNLSILQAALTGQDLRRHSTLAFAPGEVRRFDKDGLPAQRPLLSGKFKINK